MMKRLSVIYFLFTLCFIKCRSASVNGINHHFRIVGGQDVNIEDFPYQVSLLFNRLHGCGGSIINQNFILTAAHCTYDVPESTLSIRVNSSWRNEGGTVYGVQKIYVHPEFDDINYDYDISILQLNTSLSFGTGVRPVSLASAGTQITDGLESVATGWGKLGQHAPSANQLQAVTLPVISTDSCSKYYPTGYVTSRMFCAGYDEGGKDTCDGDSGGPLVVSGIQIGIVSWGIICAAPKEPGAFTKITEFVDYINSIIK